MIYLKKIPCPFILFCTVFICIHFFVPKGLSGMQFTESSFKKPFNEVSSLSRNLSSKENNFFWENGAMRDNAVQPNFFIKKVQGGMVLIDPPCIDAGPDPEEIETLKRENSRMEMVLRAQELSNSPHSFRTPNFIGGLDGTYSKSRGPADSVGQLSFPRIPSANSDMGKWLNRLNVELRDVLWRIWFCRK